MMKTEFYLTLFDDDKVKKKLHLLSRIEAMFDDERNQVPQSFRYFEENIEFGKTVKITIEVIDGE